jgi:hypothetical protein
MEYLINHKKVYRLMTENHLLSGKRIKVQGKRKFVKHRRIVAKRPMDSFALILNMSGFREIIAGITN